MCLAFLQNWHWWHQMLISRNFSLMMKSRQAQNQPSSAVKLFSAKHLTMIRNFENIIFSKSSHDLPSYTRSLVPIIPYVPLQQLPFWILLLLHSELLIEKSSWIDFKLILLVIFVCDCAISLFLLPSDQNNLSVFSVCPGILMCHILKNLKQSALHTHCIFS